MGAMKPAIFANVNDHNDRPTSAETGGGSHSRARPTAERAANAASSAGPSPPPPCAMSGRLPPCRRPAGNIREHVTGLDLAQRRPADPGHARPCSSCTPASTITASPKRCQRSTASRRPLLSKPSSRAARTFDPCSDDRARGQVRGRARGGLGLERIELAFSFFCRSSSCRSLVADLARVAAEQFRGLAELAFPGHVVQRALPGHRLDPAHAGGDAVFADDLEQPMSPVWLTWVPPHSSVEVVATSSARAPSRRTSRRTAPSRRNRALPASPCGALRGSWLARTSALTRRSSRELGRGHRLEVREVEAQIPGAPASPSAARGCRARRAGRVQQVRGAVVEDGRAAARGIHRR